MSDGHWLYRLAMTYCQKSYYHFNKVEVKEVKHHEKANGRRETIDLWLRKMTVIEDCKIIWQEERLKGGSPEK